MSHEIRTTPAASHSSKPLTIALASTQRGWHGGEEQARLLLCGLRARGCRCVVLGRRDGQFLERMTGEGFEGFGFSGNGRSPLALWQVRRFLRRLAPDVLHYNDPHALGSVGLAACGLPIAARVAARRAEFPIRSTFAYRRWCARIVCVSQRVARVCRASGIPTPLLRVVHDGVDVERARAGDRRRGRAALDVTDDQPLLMTIATLTDCKGHRYLLDALPALITRHPRLLAALAGDGELRAALSEHAEQLGVADHVRFLGYRQDVPDLIRAADVFVHPAVQEGLCSTLIEAMLAARAIVATTAGGIPELFGAAGESEPAPAAEDCEPAAWLVPPGDAAALAAAIRQALESPEECAARQQLACRRAESQFAADHMVEATLAVYRELLPAA